MFCTQCGKEIKEGTKFCRFCGAPVVICKPKPEVIEPEKQEIPIIPVEESITESQEKENIESNEINDAPKEDIVSEVPEENDNPSDVFDVFSEVDMEMEIGGKLAEMQENMEDSLSSKQNQENRIAETETASEKTKKKISPLLWVVIGAVALLIVAIIVIISLLGKLNGKEGNSINPSIPQGNTVEEPIQQKPAEEADTGSDKAVNPKDPELWDVHDDFLNSTSFNKDAPLGSKEILYMGKAYFDGIGNCHVSFILGSDRKTIKNFAIYLNDISLVLKQNGAQYDLKGVSIRQDFTYSMEYSEGGDISFGDSKITNFILDTEEYEIAYGTLDYTFSYYPPMIGGSATTPIKTPLGTSDIEFVPVRIG